MIKNTAFAAALTLFLLVAWLAGEVSYLAPFKYALFQLYGRVLVAAAAIVFLNLCALYYGVARWLFLRDTGRKLMHIDRQLSTPEGMHQELRPYLPPMPR